MERENDSDIGYIKNKKQTKRKKTEQNKQCILKREHAVL